MHITRCATRGNWGNRNNQQENKTTKHKINVSTSSTILQQSNEMRKELIISVNIDQKP